jgi:hypothetical protein
VFALLNSSILMELIDADFSSATAATVVHSIGLYYSDATKAGLHTFTTLGVPVGGRLGDPPANFGRFYTALTHSGTPVLAKILGGWAAVTDSGLNNVHYYFKGSVLIPPGVCVSFA